MNSCPSSVHSHLEINVSCLDNSPANDAPSRDLVLVYAEDANSVKHGQFWQQDGQERNDIHAEVVRIVLRVETRQEKSATHGGGYV